MPAWKQQRIEYLKQKSTLKTTPKNHPIPENSNAAAAAAEEVVAVATDSIKSEKHLKRLEILKSRRTQT